MNQTRPKSNNVREMDCWAKQMRVRHIDHKILGTLFFQTKIRTIWCLRLDNRGDKHIRIMFIYSIKFLFSHIQLSFILNLMMENNEVINSF